MPIEILRDNFVAHLRGTIRENIDRYKSGQPWLDELPNSKAASLPTTLEFDRPLSLTLPDADQHRDIENAIAVHRSMPFLTLVQARDPRLWTRLAHVECWEYMRARWPLEKHTSSDDKAARFVLSRYFVAQSEGRALLRNGVARLWWCAHLTHDGNRKNPYELTSVLLSRLDITQQILERNLGRAAVIRFGILEFLSQNREELLEKGEATRAMVRRLTKHLNMVGGTTLLDCLTKSQVADLLQEEVARASAAE